MIGVVSPYDTHTNGILEKDYIRNCAKNNFLISSQEGFALKEGDEVRALWNKSNY